MEGQKKEKLSEVGEFISEYSAHMMGCGVHTSRVIRSAKTNWRSIRIFRKNQCVPTEYHFDGSR